MLLIRRVISVYPRKTKQPRGSNRPESRVRFSMNFKSRYSCSINNPFEPYCIRGYTRSPSCSKRTDPRLILLLHCSHPTNYNYTKGSKRGRVPSPNAILSMKIWEPVADRQSLPVSTFRQNSPLVISHVDRLVIRWHTSLSGLARVTSLSREKHAGTCRSCSDVDLLPILETFHPANELSTRSWMTLGQPDPWRTTVDRVSTFPPLHPEVVPVRVTSHSGTLAFPVGPSSTATCDQHARSPRRDRDPLGTRSLPGLYVSGSLDDTERPVRQSTRLFVSLDLVDPWLPRGWPRRRRWRATAVFSSSQPTLSNGVSRGVATIGSDRYVRFFSSYYRYGSLYRSCWKFSSRDPSI